MEHRAMKSASLPLTFVLALSAEASPLAMPADAKLDHGALAPLLAAGEAAPRYLNDPAKPENGVSVDPVTKTVQWRNWANSNCFYGNWRNC
jgi:hypothetical protein